MNVSLLDILAFIAFLLAILGVAGVIGTSVAAEIALAVAGLILLALGRGGLRLGR